MKSRLVLLISIVAVLVAGGLAGRHYWAMFVGGENNVADIGGPFTLVDHTGKTVTNADFHGNLSLVYFGYTYCPDVCPTALSGIAESLETLADGADQITPIFITIDPERDTPEAMADYVEVFHPRLVGLSGSVDQVTAAARAYRVFFAKVQEKDSDPEDYLMDHSAYTYLMDRQGKFLMHFPHGADPVQMAQDIAQYL
ncbi:MAG: SCO family protein [Rhodospirillales bacterium]|nr:SCO family protein [Rhodospirillales bacterium]